MKQLIIICSFIFSFNFGFSQTYPTDSTKLVCVTLNDGTKIIGKVTQNNERELTVSSLDGRRQIIPQFFVKTISDINESDMSINGKYIGKDNYCTRYFLTTNGLPIEKGKNYIQWNLFGPDIQFSVSDHFGVGIMTSWFATPVVGSFKYSNKISKNVHYAIGGLLGTTTWSFMDDLRSGLALPFAALTFGNGRNNINFSYGYGASWKGLESQGTALYSIAGMIKLSNKLSFIFDSFITKEFGFFTPNLRYHFTETNAFQFGFAFVQTGGVFRQIPTPICQWYRRL
ncbi:MAG: hypothetical protein EBS12_00035 [Flavobacteriia bacterium]|nr:hypothetical protein [Flavobacteriia bacterium]